MKKCLIAYFSATGTTAKAAERLAEVIHGDLYEIEANPVYSNDDLNWNDKHSRSYREWKDKNSRPAIKTPVAPRAAASRRRASAPPASTQGGLAL